MCDYDHVAIYWLPSNGAIIQCGRKAHAIKAGRTSRVQQTLLSPSLRSSPSPPTRAYLPPHHHQVHGTRSSPTSSTPSLTLGDVSSRKENSLPYSCRQRATPRNQEQRLRMESQWMFWALVKEYGMESAQGVFEEVVRELGVEMNHDVLGCRDCHWEGHDIIYCRRSRHNREHLYHECPIGQECC